MRKSGKGFPSLLPDWIADISDNKNQLDRG